MEADRLPGEGRGGDVFGPSPVSWASTAVGTTARQVAAIPVLTTPAGQKITDHRAGVTAVADAIRALPGVQVLDYGSTGDPKFVTDDQRSTFVLVYAPQPRGFTDPLADAVDHTAQAAAHKQGLDARLTGYSQLSAGNTESGGPSVLAET